MHDTGCLGLVHWDDPGEHMFTRFLKKNLGFVVSSFLTLNINSLVTQYSITSLYFFKGL